MVCPVVYSYSIIYTYQNQVAIWVTISAVYLSIMVRDTQTFLTLCIMILICRPVPIDWDGFGDKAYYLYIYSAQVLPKACNAVGKEHKPVRYACTTLAILARVLMAHTEWLPGVWLRHFCTTFVVYIEDWKAGVCPVVIAQWQKLPFFFSFSSILPHPKKIFLFLAWGNNLRIWWNFTTRLSENWKILILVNVQSLTLHATANV